MMSVLAFELSSDRVATNVEKPGNLEYSWNSLNLENAGNS